MATNQLRRLGILWFLIACVVGCAMWLQSSKGEAREHAKEDAAHAEGGNDGAKGVAPIALDRELVGKVIVLLNGMRSSAPTLRDEDILRNAEPMTEEDAPLVDRLAHAVLVGHVKGWLDGVEAARAIEVSNDAERDLKSALVEVLAAREVGVELPAHSDAQARLEPKLGFFSRVACGDPEILAECWRAGIVLFMALGWYAFAFLAGLAALVLVFMRLSRGDRRTGLLVASEGFPAGAEDQSSAGITAREAMILGETFCIWLVAFLGLNIAAAGLAGIIVGFAGVEGTPRETHIGLACSAAGFFGSLVVLAYPLLRGVTGARLRSVLGFHKGRGFAAEAMHGLLCYFSAVPLLLAGLLVFMVFNAIADWLSGPRGAPSHPVVDLYAQADALRIALVFLIASVAAPIVEETMFRGALYGHLRAAVLARHRIASVLVAAVVSSFVFAVIHPQGVLFTPALGGLAVGFCLARELRGSLVAPIVAHAVNNAVTLAIGMSLLS